MTKSQILLFLCLSFLGGIFFASFFAGNVFFLLLATIIFFFAVRNIKVFFFCLVVFSFAVWHYQQAFFQIENNAFVKDIEKGKEVTIFGFIENQPLAGANSRKIIFEPFDYDQRIMIINWKYPEYEYGDEIKVKGVLKEPQVFEGFNYKEYLAKDHIFAQMLFPGIEIIEKNRGNRFLSFLFKSKKNLEGVIERMLPLPQAGLMEALLFGNEENISDQWKEKFNVTGTSHIAAVSGMNITIISSLVLAFLLSIGLRRKQAFYISVVFIIFYVLIIGAPASGVRAAIMGIMFLIGQHFGRISKGFLMIIFSAAIMLLQNPLLLKADMGFQLSFLAVLGLVYLQPLFSNLFQKVSDFFQLRYTLSSTAAAQFFVVPFLIYNFGQISLISPLANILIVPLLSFITIFGFLVSLTGLFIFPLGYILSFVLWVFLTYILKVVDFLHKVPLASLSLGKVSGFWLFLLYFLLCFFIWRLNEKSKTAFLQK